MHFAFATSVTLLHADFLIDDRDEIAVSPRFISETTQRTSIKFRTGSTYCTYSYCGC